MATDRDLIVSVVDYAVSKYKADTDATTQDLFDKYYSIAFSNYNGKNAAEVRASLATYGDMTDAGINKIMGKLESLSEEDLKNSAAYQKLQEETANNPITAATARYDKILNDKSYSDITISTINADITAANELYYSGVIDDATRKAFVEKAKNVRNNAIKSIFEDEANLISAYKLLGLDEGTWKSMSNEDKYVKALKTAAEYKSLGYITKDELDKLAIEWVASVFEGLTSLPANEQITAISGLEEIFGELENSGVLPKGWDQKGSEFYNKFKAFLSPPDGKKVHYLGSDTTIDKR